MKNALRTAKRFLVPHWRRDDFIEIDKHGFWKRRSYQGRSLQYTAKQFNKISGAVIVEIGSGIHGPMAGNSIIVWAKQTKARRILAVDLDAARIEEVKAAAGHYLAVEPILADGRDVVRDIEDPIDLLYLDFWTPDVDSTKIAGSARAESYLEIYRAAKSKLNRRALILIDDTDHIDPWKQTHIVPAARADGFSVVYVGRQTLLRRDP